MASLILYGSLPSLRVLWRSLISAGSIWVCLLLTRALLLLCYTYNPNKKVLNVSLKSYRLFHVLLCQDTATGADKEKGKERRGGEGGRDKERQRKRKVREEGRASERRKGVEEID